MIQLNVGLVIWRSFKQHCLAASSTVAGYVSLAECISKVRYLHHILRDLGGLHESTVIYEDNQPCVLWDAEYGKCNKHVDMQYHI